MGFFIRWCTKLDNFIEISLIFGDCRWKAIPFLAELRLIMDWVWTDTTLSLFHYAKIEDIYSNIYPDKCFRRNEKVNSKIAK